MFALASVKGIETWARLGALRPGLAQAANANVAIAVHIMLTVVRKTEILAEACIFGKPLS
jgi:hypothetical protein